MGMSASQARAISLKAKKSNIEYQGQQINNERTILSQQCTDLYNSLLAMTVPTPPSTQDFTKIVYSGTDGATEFKIGTIKPSGQKYNVEIQQNSYGHSLQSNYGTSIVKKADRTLQGKIIDPSVLTYSKQENYTEGAMIVNTGEYWSGAYLKSNSKDPTIIPSFNPADVDLPDFSAGSADNIGAKAGTLVDRSDNLNDALLTCQPRMRFLTRVKEELGAVASQFGDNADVGSASFNTALRNTISSASALIQMAPEIAKTPAAGSGAGVDANGSTTNKGKKGGQGPTQSQIDINGLVRDVSSALDAVAGAGTADTAKAKSTTTINNGMYGVNNAYDVSDYLVYDPITGNINEPSGNAFDDNLFYIKRGTTTKTEYEALSPEEQAKYTIIKANDNPTALKKTDLDYYFVQKADGSVEKLTVDSPYVQKNKSTDTYRLVATGGVKFFCTTGNPYDKDLIDNPNAGKITIQGKEALTFEEARKKYGNEFDWDKYEEAIKNTYGDNITVDHFYVFVTTSEKGVKSLQFALKKDVNSIDGYAKTFSYIPNGKFTSSLCIDQCKLEFDNSGRITKIAIPIIDEKTGEILSYTESALTAQSVVDDAAYQDAYAQYEYAMYQYDKTNAEINAKTEVIQQEDKNLELKLQRLDNERDAIDKELDALEKVINDNIEKTFKTFAG